MSTLNDVFNLIKFKDVEIVGSYGDPKIRYPADIDLHEHVTMLDYKAILNRFVEIINNINKSVDVYMTSFKCGTVYNGKAIHWTLNDLKRGYQVIEDRKVNFLDTLQYKSTIKLDVIALIKSRFVEITINYFFEHGSRTTRIDEDKLNSFLSSARKHLDLGDFYKALKRLYKYYLAKKETRKVKQIVDIFNSDLGQLNKSMIDLQVIQKVIKETRKKPNISDIKRNLELIARNNPKIPILNILNNIDNNSNRSLRSIYDRIESILKIWSPKINLEFKKEMIRLKLI